MRAGREGDEDAMRIKITMHQTSLPTCQSIINLRCLLSSDLHNPTRSGRHFSGHPHLWMRRLKLRAVIGTQVSDKECQGPLVLFYYLFFFFF